MNKYLKGIGAFFIGILVIVTSPIWFPLGLLGCFGFMVFLLGCDVLDLFGVNVTDMFNW